MNYRALQQIYFRIPVVLRLLITVLALMALFGVLIHFLEPTNFPTIFDGIWWAFVTGSTVGYGDFVPLSVTGRLLAIFLILAGGGFVTFYMANLSARVVRYEQDLSSGDVTYKGNDHIVLIGWNERTRQLLDMIIERELDESVVLIDQSLQNLPLNKSPIHFVRGSASDDTILAKANIKEAKCAVITSDPSEKEQQADQSSILTTVALKGNNPDLFIITEILTKHQIQNAMRAGANTVIRSNDFMSTLFFHEIFRKDPVKPFNLLLDVFDEQQFKQFELPKEMNGKTFLECSDFYAQHEEILIAIIRNGELLINPPFHKKLETGDSLIVLASLY
ncbi:potassium channel family protein [Aquibacillus sp. 3ASR75-11]|uniref:Potassium channel family protein n=1 Tax=Terrihalobacillus insolitus TaxID=2950438 RepID=A0A9X3WT78_9BACI|nr:potassium channel family protein [Terrihalobacillus insolitus]MDC3412393.1 potassium channel family protein [Terrihalobacillus insolitus]MDC3422914.1 potassium channel family protein [Terrihalobacillus insolitus]